MIKKLVKHGNSCALILDRTILSLLEINENSILKLRVEGDTLIIKAAGEISATDSLAVEFNATQAKLNVHPTKVSSALAEVNEAQLVDGCKKIESDPAAIEALENWLPGTENAEKLQQEIGKILEKYQEELAPLNSENFNREMEALVDQFEGAVATIEFHEAALALRRKHAPGAIEMDKEMIEVARRLGMPENLMTS